jgi:hypothetical protein
MLADEFHLALCRLIPVRKRQPLLLKARLLKNQVNVSLRHTVTEVELSHAPFCKAFMDSETFKIKGKLAK